MNPIYLLLLLLHRASAITDCQHAILDTLSNTTSLLDQYLYSGKFVNELGDYYQCTHEMAVDGYTYSLALIYGGGTPYVIDAPKYAWGFCIKAGCNKTSLQPFDEFIHQSKAHIIGGGGGNQSAIEYIIPKDDLERERSDRQEVFNILIVLVGFSAMLGLLGVVVEYTRLGNVKLNHEETNFANIDIPIFLQGDNSTGGGWEQLSQILMVKDELLRNSKSLWATIILCFSFTRNLRHLFYKFKLQPERVKHRNTMYAVWVIGFCWFILFTSVYVGLKSYPQNIWMLPKDLTHWLYIVTHGGQLFGLNMIYLAWGYIVAVNFLSFSNYLPHDFFSPLRIGGKKERVERSQSFVDKRGGTEINGLDFVQVVHSDASESRYYFKRQEFTFVVNILRKYIRLFVPLSCAILGMKFILPFLGSGPLYLVLLRDQFLTPCEGSWLLSLSLFQNWFYFSKSYDSATCYPCVSDDQCLITTTDLSVSSCSDTCGQYLAIFANLFQFYLLSVGIMYVHKYFRRVAYSIILLLIGVGMGVSYILIATQGIKAYLFFDADGGYMRYLVHRPWFRLPSYLIGMLFGLIISRIHSARYNVDLSLPKVLLLQAVGLGMTLASMFTLKEDFRGFQFEITKGFDQKETFTPLVAAIYTCGVPIIFNIGLLLILLPSLLYVKQEGLQSHMQAEFEVNLTTLLRYDGWRVLYKLSQSAYILHYCVIFWYYASVHSNGIILGKTVIMRAQFGAIVVSFSLGVLYYLLFDKPIRNLDRMVLFPSKISDSFLIKKSAGKASGDEKKKVQKKAKYVDNKKSVRFTSKQFIYLGEICQFYLTNFREGWWHHHVQTRHTQCDASQ